MVYAKAMQMQCTWSVKERKGKERKVKKININYACFLEIFRNFFEIFLKKSINLIFLPKISKNY